MSPCCRARVLVVLFFALLSSGCLSDEDRGASHVERASEYLAEGDTGAALIEIQAALRAQPNSAEANHVMARVVASQGDLGSAIDFYQEALLLEPERTEAALELASILRAEDPQRALELLQPIEAREPENALLHGALSEVAVARGDLRSALRSIDRAIELDPGRAASHQKRGEIAVLQAVGAENRAKGKSSADTAIDRALASFDRALELGIESPWRAELGRARALATARGRDAETQDAFRRAVESALNGHGDQDAHQRKDQKRATLEALAFARRTRDREFERWVLERRVQIDPGNILAWEELAKTYPRIHDRDAVFERLLAERPDDFEAHQGYARHLVLTRRLDAGLAYFEEQVAAGNEPARMRAAHMNLLLRIGRTEDAREQMEALLALHPDDPRTRLEVAHQKLRRGQVEEASIEMRRLAEEAPSKEGLEALADLEYRLGNLEEAREAIEAASDLTSRYDVRVERLHAQIARDQGDYVTTRKTLEEMRIRTQLSHEEQLDLARSSYATGRRMQAKAVLEDLVRRPRAPVEAALLLAEQEGADADAETRQAVRNALQGAFARNFGDPQLLTLLTRIDLEDGRRRVAVARLDRVIQRKPEASIAYVLRAGVHYADGDVARARQDLETLLARNPSDRSALLALRDLALETDRPEIALGAFEAAPGAIGEFEHPVALGTLYHAAGRSDEAIASYERALEEGQSAEVDNNLAFLLIERAESGTASKASKERDLSLALELAVRANQQEQRNAAMRDTLGLARLANGDAPHALLEFMAAAHLADPPSAEYFFHRGVAEEALGDHEAARRSYDKALAIDAEHPGARAARNSLKTAAADAP